MEVVADSHALFWWLGGPELRKKLSRKAQRILEEATRVYVPAVVLLELLSLFERHGEPEKFSLLLSRLAPPTYHVLPLSLAIVRRCAQLPSSLELHDRVIVATADHVHARLVSKDRKIRTLFADVVW